MSLVNLAINPIPSGVAETTVSGYDGTPLRAALWQPTRGPARGTVCIVQGRGEFIEKYFEVVSDLRRRGFAVAIADLRGQGGSERILSDPRKGYVQGFTEYDRDLSLFMKQVVKPSLPPPYIALGHSMGGNILLRRAQSENSPFSRIILVSPMIAINERLLQPGRKWARLYAELLCLIGFSGAYVRGGGPEPMEIKPFEDNQLTSDRVRWERNKAVLEQRPDLGLGSATVGWLRAALRSCGLLARADYAKYVTVPTLIYVGSADQIVSPQAIEDFAADLKIGGLIRIPGSRHEILQESDAIRSQFWAAFDAYMQNDDLHAQAS